MKYKNFRTVARVFVILAWLVGIGTFVMGLAGGFVGGGINIIVGIIIGVVGGFLSFIFIYAFSQFIYVLIDIERNTRRTLRALLEEVEMEEVEKEEVEKEEEIKAEKGE
ncbi:unnamed protein product [marine sediment metagenome]|uniref:DUF4282 domain-containing protein n=1 Tax=marine sediment metagenome TaxID=412755 RepID=X0XTE4_9ZZZZ